MSSFGFIMWQVEQDECVKGCTQVGQTENAVSPLWLQQEGPKKSTSETDGQSAKKVMRQRITRRRAVKTEVSAPRRKLLRAHFSALIPLVSGTDIHYRDIISLSTHMAQKKELKPDLYSSTH